MQFACVMPVPRCLQGTVGVSFGFLFMVLISVGVACWPANPKPTGHQAESSRPRREGGGRQGQETGKTTWDRHTGCVHGLHRFVFQRRVRRGSGRTACAARLPCLSCDPDGVRAPQPVVPIAAQGDGQTGGVAMRAHSRGGASTKSNQGDLANIGPSCGSKTEYNRLG